MGIHQPHDKFFRLTLKLKEVAADFLKANLRQKVLRKLDLGSLELQDGSFIDSKFRAYCSDVLLRVDGTEGKGYLYFLLEHQSTSDPFIVVRLLQYIANIVNYDMKRQLSISSNRSNLKVPAIYPFVLYSGKEKYRWPESFSIEVGGLPLLDLSSSLIELQGCSLEELLKSKKAALMQFLLKESWKKDFCKVLKDNPQLGELINSSPYAKDAVLYMVDQDPHRDQVIKKIRNLNQNVREKVMNGLQTIEKRGYQRGIKLGEQVGEEKGKIEGIKLGERVGEERGFKEAILKLLAYGIDKAKAAEMLGLSLKKLENLLTSTD